MTDSTLGSIGDENDGDKVVTLRRSEIRALEQKAKGYDALVKENEALKKTQTFAEAGIDLKDPKMGYFIKGYDGEMTVDSIRAAATEAGFIEPPQQTPEQIAQLGATQQIVAASAGAAALSAQSEAAMRSEMEAAMASGGKDAVMAVARKYGAVSTEDFS